MQIELEVNGTGQRLAVEPRRTLVDVLRYNLQLTGTKKVCDMGNCGACTVMVDGRAMYSCLMLAMDCEGRAITTIEGLDADGELSPVQRLLSPMFSTQASRLKAWVFIGWISTW